MTVCSFTVLPFAGLFWGAAGPGPAEPDAKEGEAKGPVAPPSPHAASMFRAITVNMVHAHLLAVKTVCVLRGPRCPQRQGVRQAGPWPRVGLPHPDPSQAAGVVTAALEVGFCGYEDAVLLEAARGARAAGIVTRNIQDLASADMPVSSPSELLSAVLASKG